MINQYDSPAKKKKQKKKEVYGYAAKTAHKYAKEIWQKKG